MPSHAHHPRPRQPHRYDYELLPRASSDSLDLPDLPDLAVVDRKAPPSSSSWLRRIADLVPLGVRRIASPSTYAHYITPRRRRRSLLRTLYWAILSFPCLCLFLVLFCSLFLPSYTYPPAHYQELRQRSLQSSLPGRANPRNEKVFIAASLYEVNGELTGGAWADSVLQLVHLLGPQNVYLSVYENDPDEASQQSLRELARRTPSNSSIVFEHLDLADLPHVALPNGEKRLKRIAFLAEVRNRALAPIDNATIAFDRILYINDVNFHPIDAAQLLLSTNVDAAGRATYGAVCAVDFINAFKFYDRFASRDLDGYSMGIPFYPWFTSAGTGTSRKDVLSGTDAVRVRSCWGGMAAFEAKWFQDTSCLHGSTAALASNTSSSTLPSVPLRFRYETDAFWESSECCLINADLQYLRTGQGMPIDSGIYVNPYIRVAYDTTTLSWLALSRRPERLYALIHDILNRWVGFPGFNPRRVEEAGQLVSDSVWEYDDPTYAFSANATAPQRAGHYSDVQRVASPGGFCGQRNLLVINEHPKPGERKWGSVRPPMPA